MSKSHQQFKSLSSVQRHSGYKKRRGDPYPKYILAYAGGWMIKRSGGAVELLQWDRAWDAHFGINAKSIAEAIECRFPRERQKLATIRRYTLNELDLYIYNRLYGWYRYGRESKRNLPDSDRGRISDDHFINWPATERLKYQNFWYEGRGLLIW